MGTPKIPVNAPDNVEEFKAYMQKLMPEITADELNAAWSQYSKMTLAEKLVATMNEYGTTLVTDLKKQFEEQITIQKNTLEKDLVTGIRTGLGLDSNPAVHLKDLQQIVRDLVLKEVEATKKSGGEPPVRDTPPPDQFAAFDFSARIAKDRRIN